IGFKSFADYQKIEFKEGITDIVGPNGCGKSNIADAIRWVLGEQKSKALRGSCMQDVIFNGTEKRKGMSFCEVTLTFDNTNKIFDCEYDEVIISRKLYRSGESEYLINKSQVRLRDIVTLLHDTGIGKGGYSIIGQGMVSQIVDSKPEDRRAIFEEAAGIAKFKAKKLEAEKKLQNTQDNILRINDLITEIDRQLKPLKKQAESALQYKELKEQLKLLEINDYLYRYDYSNDTKNAIQEKINAIVEDLNYRLNEKEKSNTLYNETFDKVNSIDGTISSLKDKIMSLNIAITKQSGETNLVQEKYNHYKLEDERLSAEINRLKADKKLSEELFYETETKLKNRQSVLFDLKASASSLEEKYSSISNELKFGEDEVLDSQKKLFENLNKLGDVKAQISALNTEKNNLDITITDLESQKESISSKFSESKSKENESSSIVTSLQVAVSDNQNELNKLIVQQNEAQTNVKSLESYINELSSNILSFEHRKKILEDMAKEYEGYSGTIKRLFTAAENDYDVRAKIIGLVANLIKVPEMYQTAIEIALGNAVQNIVTYTEQDAKYLIQYLKQRDFGRATFLPISTVKPRYFDDKYSHIFNMDGCFGIASNLIKYEDNISNVISSLLGNTIIARDLNSATEIAKSINFVYRICTLDGDIISPQGSYTGGSKKSTIANLLSRDSEIQNCITNIEKLTQTKEVKVNEYNNLLASLNELSNNITSVSNKLKNNEIELASEKERHSKYVSICDDYMEEENRINISLAKNRQLLSNIEIKLSEISNIHNDMQSTDISLDNNVNQFSELKQKREEYNIELTQARIKLATVEGEILSLQQEYDRLKSNIESITEHLEMSQKDYDKNNILYNQANNMLTAAMSNLENDENYALLKNCESELKSLEESKGALQQDLKRYDESRTELQEQVNILQDRKYRQEINLSKVDSDIEALQNRVWTEYGVSYNTAQEYRMENFDAKMGNAEIAKIKKDINALGPINENAIEDSKALEERFGKIYNQAQDLIKADSDLKNIIKDLSNEMVTRFKNEFDKINTNFGIVFGELFGGGKATLEILEDEDKDLLQAGIEIKAQPPEKKLDNITLLSGGEKSLIGIAILFAIIKLRPMPFCLLDEIEAALDEANATRLAVYLKKYSVETQFIVITHKKPTMEHANNLFGVTMQEKGVSRVISVSLSDAINSIKES
ncbi:MAG: chromosome segregation protein SMC, partial [Clostridia bacterium]|nr:chromosome segregation protein SMC [Clostridia bacterium]